MSDIANDASRDLTSETKVTHIIYALYALGFITGGLTWIAGIITNYVKRDDVKGTLLESHFDWQIRMFWWSLLWSVVGIIFCVTVIGLIIGVPLLIGSTIWAIYRIIKGWLKLNDNLPIA